MSIKFEELAIELKSSVGELTNLAETLGLPFAAREPLTNEDADKLRKSFREQPKGLAAPQLNPAPIRNVADIQQTDSSSVTSAQEEDPTGSDLEIAYKNLLNAQAAQDTQAQEVFEEQIREIKHRNIRLGVMKRVFAKTAEIEGFMAADNAITESEQKNTAATFKRQTAMLTGEEGADFLLNSYPSAAQLSTEIPEPPQSIAQQTLDILNRLKGL
ncbi:hypothetical protein QT972_09855 [Microcoleus sp. herbarium7]|uniref:hypothetical protein n=1 Tax=Microcoleus sp. herbarium7 TaxID=3055435 RepID=UPI002FD1935F